MPDLKNMILDYQPNPDVKNLLSSASILLLVGPTGTGKNTLEKQLLKTGKFKQIITHTTRPPRINHGVLEQDGEEYHFVSDSQAMQLLKEHQFVEAALTHGHLYGTSISEFKTATKEGKIAVADIDIKGVKSYQSLSPNVKAIFLLPPSFEVLIKRLVDRYGQSHDKQDIKVRLNTALAELNELLNSNFYYLMVNTDINETTGEVLKIVSEKLDPEPNPEALQLAKQLISDIKDYLDQQR